jgi:hypothetical protein
MTSDAKRAKLVADLLQRFWQSDWSIMSHFAEEALLEDPLLPEPCRGKEEILQTFEFCHAWAELAPELRLTFASGRYAMAEFVVKGTVINPLDGYPAEVVGAPFDFGEVDVFEFGDDGRILRMSIYADVVGFDRQLREYATSSAGSLPKEVQ